MKTRIVTLAMMLCFVVAAMAKDIKTVVLTTSPQMHCENCENKIKTNIRFEKGVKEITTDLKTKTVTIKYDADKTNVDNIIKGFAKIDYKAAVAGSGAGEAKSDAASAKASSCCGSDGCKCGSGTPCGSSCGSSEAKKGDNVAFFKAVQMNCGGCAAKVKNALTAVKGVEDVTVDLPTKSVKVSYDAAQTDVDKLKEAFYGIKYASPLYYPEDASVAYASFQADQMKCGGCAAKVRKNLSADAGVKDISICLDTKVVSIAYDSKLTSVDKLIEDFKKFDYNVVQCYNNKK